MGPWPGTKETADIVFKDGDNQELTHLLINHGHLPNDFLRQGARLTYYLEVKTTTKECATRFYMSKAQHQRVSNPPHDACSGSKSLIDRGRCV